MGANLEVDTRLTRTGDGRYTLDLSNEWSFFNPSGGVLLGIGVRAMQETLGDPAQRIVSSTAIFCVPIQQGPIQVTVDVLRRGRAASQLRATLSNRDAGAGGRAAGMEVISTFARDRDGPDVTGRRMPEAPPPDECRVAPHRQDMAFFRNVEDRVARGHFWSERDWEAGEAEYARWIRYCEPVRGPDGFMPEYALSGPADLMPPALLQALGPESPRFAAPSLDLTMHYFAKTKREWLLSYVRCLRARDGTASCSVELWDQDAQLLAFATQVMLLRRWAR
jgi:acyl-CoA thioesterase